MEPAFALVYARRRFEIKPFQSEIFSCEEHAGGLSPGLSRPMRKRISVFYVVRRVFKGRFR